MHSEKFKHKYIVQSAVAFISVYTITINCVHRKPYIHNIFKRGNIIYFRNNLLKNSKVLNTKHDCVARLTHIEGLCGNSSVVNFHGQIVSILFLRNIILFLRNKWVSRYFFLYNPKETSV